MSGTEVGHEGMHQTDDRGFGELAVIDEPVSEKDKVLYILAVFPGCKFTGHFAYIGHGCMHTRLTRRSSCEFLAIGY